MSGATSVILAAGIVASNLVLVAAVTSGRLRTPAERRKPPAPAWTITSLQPSGRPAAAVSPADAHAALQAAGGNASRAAAALGMSRTTFRRRIHEHQLANGG